MNLFKCGIILILAGILLFVCCIILLLQTVFKIKRLNIRRIKSKGLALNVKLEDGTDAVFYTIDEGIYIEENKSEYLKGMLVIKKGCK